MDINTFKFPQKVYCINCVHLISRSQCHHPKNKYISVVRNWLERKEVEQFQQSPEDRNKNNSCKLYEPKEGVKDDSPGDESANQDIIGGVTYPTGIGG